MFKKMFLRGNKMGVAFIYRDNSRVGRVGRAWLEE